MNYSNIFSAEHSMLGDIIANTPNTWEIFVKLKDLIIALGKNLPSKEYETKGEYVWISKSAKVAPTACILGPTIICENAEIRHSAFIRGTALIGKCAVVGNSTEIKNSVLYDKTQVPHYNYVGDSILGYKAHMGAGAITSNVKGNNSTVSVITENGKIDTGLRKFGALIGDNAEISCGTVLNPGTIIGKNTQVYPLSSVRGTIGDNMIYKSADIIISKI